MDFSDLVRADLITPREVYTLYAADGLNWISRNFAAAQAVMPTGCPFDGTLILYRRNGQTEAVSVATDGCPYFKTADGRYFAFGDRDAALRQDGSTSGISSAFFSWFGVTVDTLYSGENPNSL